MASQSLRKAGLIAAGLLLGLLLVALGLYLYLRAAQVGQLETALEERLNLPAEALELEEISPEGLMRISLRDVVLVGEGGDTIAAAPLLALWFDPQSLEDPGPVVFTEVLLRDPYLRLVQLPDGEWNIFRALEVRAAGREVQLTAEDEPGRAVLFRDIEIEDGRVVVAVPAQPVDTASFAARLELPTTRIGESTYRVFRFRDVDAFLPAVRVGGEEGWRAEVARLNARLAEPELRIEQLRMQIASAGEEAVRFQLDVLRFGQTELAGGGQIRFTAAGPAFDVQLQAQPLAFADLQGILPTLPAEGQARFALGIETVGPERTVLAFQDLAVEAPGVEAGGRLEVVVGGAGPPTFRDTRLDIARLELQALERFGLVEEVPLRGVVRGTVATEGPVEGVEEGALQVNLTARVTPRGQPEAEPSVITAVGGVALGGEEVPFRLQDLRLQLEPLRLVTLAELLPEQQERLRGVVRGGVTLTGAPAELRFREGALEYRVGEAPPTRLTGLAGEIALEPELRYDLRAEAQPLALATLTELFPALPFRTAALTGPIRVAGGPERVELDADLAGAAGALSLAGDITLGETPRFDFTGRVQTFTPAAVLRAELPIEGALTGTFGVRGTPQDLAFNVDLAQTAGRFALRGQLLRPEGEEPRFEVAGQVEQFRLGALIGRPGLFPEPLTGDVALRGGGPQPYRFDLDLRGEETVLDIEGFYNAGDVPNYAVTGQIAGLNLARLPFADFLPTTDLNARVRIQGRGTTLETLAGSFVINAEGSTISGIPVDAAVLRAEVREGVLLLDTLALVLRDTRIAAEGTLGLTRPAPGRLEYRLAAPDLATLARLFATDGLEPEIAGDLLAEGWISGTLRAPTLAVELRGRELRYNAWRAGQLALDAEVERQPGAGWAGEATLVGDNLVLATGEMLEALRLEVNGTQQQIAVGMFARRDDASDLALSAIVEMAGPTPRGLVLDRLDLRYGGIAWGLEQDARIRWSGVEGIAVQDFLLRRTDAERGVIRVDGMLPPTGTADLLVRVEALDLGALRSLFTGMPEVRGELSLEGVLEGPVTDPQLVVQATLDSLRYQGAEADSVSVSGRYDDGILQTNAAVWTAAEQVVDIEARVPMVLSIADLLPSFELRREAPLFARAVVDSLDLSLITAAVPALIDGEGAIAANAVVRGTLERPLLQGSAYVYNGAVGVLPLGVRYRDITARIFLEENAVLIDSLTAYNDGRVTASGTIRFEAPSAPDVYLITNFSSFEVMDVEDVAHVQLTGQLAVSGQFPNPVLSGSITVLESTITIPELDEPTGTEIGDVEIGQIGADTLEVAPAGAGLLAGVRVEELTVNVGEDVWLVSEDARIQLAGELVVYRTGEDLRVFGALQTPRGTYRLEIGPLAREFDIRRGRVQFFGTEDLNPELDIVATNRIRTVQVGATTPITVVVNITGTIQFPRIQLTSDTRPPLPESEILSLLLFGRPSFELGAGTTGLAEGVLAQEALVGLFSPLERIFLSTGLIDYVNIRSVGSGLGLTQLQESLGTTTVEFGTELSDDIFWTVECGVGVIFGSGTANCGTRVQLDLGNNLTASAAYEPLWRDRLLQLLSTSNDLEYQASLQFRKRWEFGITDAPEVLEGPPARLPDEPRQNR